MTFHVSDQPDTESDISEEENPPYNIYQVPPQHVQNGKRYFLQSVPNSKIIGSIVQGNFIKVISDWKSWMTIPNSVEITARKCNRFKSFCEFLISISPLYSFRIFCRKQNCILHNMTKFRIDRFRILNTQKRLILIAHTELFTVYKM